MDSLTSPAAAVKTGRTFRAVKPAVCVSEVLREPLTPCEILPAGLPGVLVINGTTYSVEVLGYLPEVGEPVIDGYRLTKPDGTAHDICLVAGRLECSCGDWIFRRSVQVDRSLADCKHCLAVRRHLVAPVDQQPRPAPAAIGFEITFEDP
jgi:hypothetical protein